MCRFDSCSGHESGKRQLSSKLPFFFSSAYQGWNSSKQCICFDGSKAFIFFLEKFSNRKHNVSLAVFNVITRKTLLDYSRKYPEAAVALQNWYYELLNSEFRNFNELKRVYGKASLVGDDRVVFNILGNKYRLVARIVFEFKAIQIKWFGTHAEYDKIDVTTISHKKK